MKNLSESVLEVLLENFGGQLSNLSYAKFDVKKSVIDFLEEEGEGFKIEGNYFGAYLEEGDKVHYISFTNDVPSYIVLEKSEEYPVLYSGTDITDYNRIVYKSEDGFYANYDHNQSFYFDYDNYPSDIVEEWES